jgi:hypothetical protein
MPSRALLSRIDALARGDKKPLSYRQREIARVGLGPGRPSTFTGGRRSVIVERCPTIRRVPPRYLEDLRRHSAPMVRA